MGNSKSKNVQNPPSNSGAAVHTLKSKFDKITLNQIYKIYINSDISEPSTFSYLKKLILVQLRKKGYDKDTLPPNTKSMVTIYVMLYSLNEKYSEDINIPFYKNVNLMDTLMEKLMKNKQKYQNKYNTCNSILQGGERLTKRQIKILYNETLKNIDAGNNHNKIHYSDSWIRQSQTLVKITSSLKWSMNKDNNTMNLLEKEIKSLRK